MVKTQTNFVPSLKTQATTIRYFVFHDIIFPPKGLTSIIKPGSQYIARDVVRPEVIIFSMGFAASRATYVLLISVMVYIYSLVVEKLNLNALRWGKRVWCEPIFRELFCAINLAFIVIISNWSLHHNYSILNKNVGVWYMYVWLISRTTFLNCLR